MVTGGRRLWEVDDREWDTVIGTDLTRRLAQRQSGRPPTFWPPPAPAGWVVVGSAAGSLGLPGMGPYAAAKHGVVGLVRSLAADLAGTAVTANAVAPGTTATVIAEASAAFYGLEGAADLVVHQEPLGRLVGAPTRWRPPSVGCARPAAAAVTGAVVAVDGGLTATP